MPNQENTTKGFFHKTLKNFTRLLSGGYREIAMSSTLRPFSCGSLRERCTKEPDKMDQFYCGELQCGLEPMSVTAEDFPGERTKVEKDAKVAQKKARQCVGGSGCGAVEEFELARKMKEMEMVDAGDVEQVLDIEEAPQYYSRLMIPVYVEIIDSFFMDMYDDFSAPPLWQIQRIQHPATLSKCFTGSRRRVGLIRL